MIRPSLALLSVLAGCQPSPAPKPVPIYIAPADAAALLDAGPSPCALACGSWALGGCREATPNCLAVCEQASAEGLYSSAMLGCVSHAKGEKRVLETCGYGMCP